MVNSAKRDWKVESKLQSCKAGFRCRNYIVYTTCIFSLQSYVLVNVDIIDILVQISLPILHIFSRVHPLTAYRLHSLLEICSTDTTTNLQRPRISSNSRA